MTCSATWLAICAALALGEACGFSCSRFASLWPAALALGAFACLAIHASGARVLKFALAFFTGLVLSLFAAHTRSVALADATSRSSGKPFVRIFTVEGEARALPPKNGISWTSFPAQANCLKVRVVFPRSEDAPMPRVGESWECAGWLQRMKEDDIGRRRRLWIKGTGTYARPVRTRHGDLAARLGALRDELSRRMGIGLDESECAADLNRAILLGERTRISSRDRDAFVAAGTIHIFAISGLHVMLVAQTLFVMLSLLRCPLRLVGPLLIPVLWLYVAMTGFSPSAVRACSMATLQYLAPLFWRKSNGLVAWSLTFLVVYSIDPMKMFDTGCALSFAVMLGIMFWGRFTAEFVRGRTLSAIVMSLSTWAVGTPIAAHAFGRVTPGGILANLALIPAAGISVKAALAGLLASVFSEKLAAHINNFAALVANAMSGLSRAVSRLPGANMTVSPWSAATCVAWYAFLALALIALRRYLEYRRSRL